MTLIKSETDDHMAMAMEELWIARGRLPVVHLIATKQRREYGTTTICGRQLFTSRILTDQESKVTCGNCRRALKKRMVQA